MPLSGIRSPSCRSEFGQTSRGITDVLYAAMTVVVDERSRIAGGSEDETLARELDEFGIGPGRNEGDIDCR
jgi:hypothetical protein